MKITVKEFYNRCILISIINGVMTLENCNYCSMHSWDDCNYSTNDWSGTRATVTFFSGRCIAACRDENSERLTSYKEAGYYLKDIKQDMYETAYSETLQYLLENVGDKTVPLITAAFWMVDDMLYSIDNQGDMMENGMHILKDQLFSDTDKIFDDYKEEYEMSAIQVDFAKYLFDLKMKSKDSPVYINAKDFPAIFDGKQDDSEGIVSLHEMGIVVIK